MSRTAAGHPRRSHAVHLALHLGLIVGVGALGVACSRKSAERAPFPVADTLGNGLPVALVPLLSPWTAMWRTAMPGFDLDSLAFAGRIRAFGGGDLQRSDS